MKHKNLITVVTAHQLTADTIAKAIGANEKHDGYYLGNGYAVTWTGGQLIEAAFSPEESFVLSTNMDCRLVYAHNFKFAMRDYDELLGYKKSEKDKKQLATIKSLWKMSRVVVNAMNPDFEGDRDFLNLYYHIASPVEVRRAWLPVLRKKAILHAVTHGPGNRKEYEQWLSDSICNHLVKFTEESLAKKGTPLVEQISTAEAASVAESIGAAVPADGETQECDNYIVRFSDKMPLFNLSSLLMEAAVTLDFDHEKTVATALRLYGKQLISYPLTMQNTIPSGIWKAMHGYLRVLRHNTKWGKGIKSIVPSKTHNFRNGESVYNGHGIVTTGLHPVGLERDEERLYNLIVKRVIEAFEPDPKPRRKWWKKRRLQKAISIEMPVNKP